MVKRTTVELDEDLLNRARRALGSETARATIEEALRRAAAEGEDAEADRAARQRRDLETLEEHLDLDVLASNSMWR